MAYVKAYFSLKRKAGNGTSVLSDRGEKQLLTLLVVWFKSGMDISEPLP